MRVYVLQHAEPETPGLIADILRERGVALETVRVDAGGRVPRSMDGRDGLVVMGGPMGVYEADRYPFLRDEIVLIRDAIQRACPVLGVCLGSQLVASALGARVAPGRKEIGWYPVTLTEAASRDALWREIRGAVEVFQWHGDEFDLPGGAVSLAASNGVACQAFRHGSKTYGLLFHMEVSESMVRGMVESFGGDITAAGASAGDILAHASEGVREMGKTAGIVFRRWADLLGSRG